MVQALIYVNNFPFIGVDRLAFLQILDHFHHLLLNVDQRRDLIGIRSQVSFEQNGMDFELVLDVFFELGRLVLLIVATEHEAVRFLVENVECQWRLYFKQQLKV